ncbi:hypothetical protein Lal_00008082 [Lupinus albus]|nr:hypothetical protein Lal_00008082 [Lupinus albus]
MNPWDVFESFVLKDSCQQLKITAHNNEAQSQNPRSPFYMHPGENPRVILVSIPLDGSNYHS